MTTLIERIPPFLNHCRKIILRVEVFPETILVISKDTV